jgi:dihydroflavonol-4-reductase
LKAINTTGTTNIVNACLSSTSPVDLCFISSTASIGGVEKKITDESEPYSLDQANSYYSTTKYLAELEVYRGREEGLRCVILNPCIVLGFGNWNQGSAKLFRNGVKGFPFYTSGSNAFVDARDVALAASQLMQQEKFEGKYLCTAWNKKFVEVFTTIARAFGSKPPRIHVSKLMAEIAWRCATVIRFFSGSGIITKQSARAGLKNRSYSSQKLIDEMSFKFRDFNTSISEICKEYSNLPK